MNGKMLDGDVAIVTGSARGIGREIARVFASEGAHVAVADVDAEGGEETVRRVEEQGGSATFYETDVIETAAVEDAVDSTMEEFGSVDVLVNNAGGSFDDDNLHRIDESVWEKNLAVNLTGQFLFARHALPAMVESGGGAMVHMSSVNGITGIGLTAYSAAKSGVLSLSRNIATQYGRHGIRSNVICPGTIETETRRKEMEESGGGPAREQWLDQYPVGRLGRPEDVAKTALYLASDMADFVTGTEIVVDGGLTAGLDATFQQTIYDVDERPGTE